MTVENSVLKNAWLAVAATTILFRVNTGVAWVTGGGKAYRLTNGDIVVPSGRPVALGFGDIHNKPVAGTSDLVGWTEVIITPAMVGCRVAVFTAIEAKRTTGGRTSSDQAKFIRNVTLAGGIAGVANTPATAVQIVKNYQPPLVS